MSVNQIFLSGFGLGCSLGLMAWGLTVTWGLTRSGLREI